MRKARTDVPRCQRTFKRLGGGAPCPFCPDAEIYHAVSDPDLLAYAAHALEEVCHLFGKSPDANRPARFWLGLRPECVWEPADKGYDLYLQAGSDQYQLRLQVGHELFHRACSRGRIFHWTHEMLACLISVHCLRKFGYADYAALSEQHFAVEAGKLSAFEMQAVDLWASPRYPHGFYGRAYVTGAALAEWVGYPALRRLARSDPPDVERWLLSLSPGQRVWAARLFGITKEEK